MLLNLSNIKPNILGNIIVNIIGDNGTWVPFENSAPFIKCTTKTGGTTIHDAEDLDLIILMYNRIQL